MVGNYFAAAALAALDHALLPKQPKRLAHGISAGVGPFAEFLLRGQHRADGMDARGDVSLDLLSQPTVDRTRPGPPPRPSNSIGSCSCGCPGIVQRGPAIRKPIPERRIRNIQESLRTLLGVRMREVGGAVFGDHPLHVGTG